MPFFFSLLRVSIRASMGLRGAFLIQSGLMIVNNLIFFLIWILFFREFKSVGGWTLDDMFMLMAVGTGAYGLCNICFGGVRTLSKTILQGDLDTFMTQPKNILLHVAASKSQVKGWGHLMTGFLILPFSAVFSIKVLCLAILGMICGCLVFTSVAVMAHSLVFWLGSIEVVCKKYCDSLFLFMLYPTNIYSGMLQVVMFTLIPAGVIGFMPVELARDFSILKLIGLLGSAAIFCLAAFWVFYAGLKRYQSGSRFGARFA